MHAAENKCSKLWCCKSNALIPHPYNDLRDLTTSGLRLPPLWSLCSSYSGQPPCHSRHVPGILVPQDLCISFSLCILLECSPPDIRITFFLTPSGPCSNVTFLGEILDSHLENCKPFHVFLHWDFQFSFLFYFHRICHYLTHSMCLLIVHFSPLEGKLSEADFFLFVHFFGHFICWAQTTVWCIQDNNYIAN